MKKVIVKTDEQRLALLEKEFIDVKDLFTKLTHDELVSLRKLVPFVLEEVEPHDKVKKNVIFNEVVKNAPIQFAKLFGNKSFHWVDGLPVIWMK